jgi:mono/diheme cytochrome c family protein
MLKHFLIGVLFTLAAILLGGIFLVSQGRIPANADGKPPYLEKWIARTSLHATIERESPKIPNPQAFNDANLIAGIKLYAVNCAVCHGASDGALSNISIGLYQHAPPLMKHGVEDDPEGETFWKVKHGIRLTGMPSYSGTLTEKDIWNITLFLKHMDALTPKAQKAWKAVPSAVSN